MKKLIESKRMNRTQERYINRKFDRDTKKFMKYIKKYDKYLYGLMRGEIYNEG